MPVDRLDTHRSGAAAGLPKGSDGRRSFLFLQGPISDFYQQLARALIARGHRVHKVNLHLGDRVLYRGLPASNFRGRFDEWRGFVARLLDQHAVTELVVHGDRRPHHLVAAEEARARGIAVLATDLGYLRPDWITLEPDGMTTYSRFPRDPAVIRELAERFPEPEFEQRFHTPFRLIASLDVVYNVAMMLGRPIYPGYRQHGIFHPLAEYAGWLSAWPGRRLRRQRAYDAKIALQSNPRTYFLFPLQLANDFQIRAHSPYADARDAVREVVRSYAASGDPRRLAVVVHPLDNGLISWRRLVMETARLCGAAERVEVLDGGIPTDVIRAASGVVTINSTVGVTALTHGVPVKVLGNAVFDIAGLTHAGPLETFWADPTPPEPELTAAFLRALAGATQVKGGYYTRLSQARAIETFVERLERGVASLLPTAADNLAPPPILRSELHHIAIAATGGLGLALARVYAEPGAVLHLIGFAGRDLAVATRDCRRRGASVAAAPLQFGNDAAIAEYLARLDRQTPLEMLIVDRALALDDIAERMQHRGRGRIARLEDETRLPRLRLVTTTGAVDPLAAGRDPELPVSVVRCGQLAAWLALQSAAPAIAAVHADRAARLIRRGLARGHKVIAFPDPVTASGRFLLTMPRKLRGMAGRRLFATVAPVVQPIEEEPLRENGTAD